MLSILLKTFLLFFQGTWVPSAGYKEIINDYIFKPCDFFFPFRSMACINVICFMYIVNIVNIPVNEGRVSFPCLFYTYIYCEECNTIEFSKKLSWGSLSFATIHIRTNTSSLRKEIGKTSILKCIEDVKNNLIISHYTLEFYAFEISLFHMHHVKFLNYIRVLFLGSCWWVMILHKL